MALPLKWQNSHPAGQYWTTEQHCRDAMWWRIRCPLAERRQCNQPVQETMETENTKKKRKKKNEWTEKKSKEGRELN